MKQFTCRGLLGRAVFGGVLLAWLLVGCSPLVLGSRFRVDPTSAIKVGHDRKKDVVTKMGAPYRSSVDSGGREVLTYLWADGEGAGQKCTIALNKNGIVYLVELYP